MYIINKYEIASYVSELGDVKKKTRLFLPSQQYTAALQKINIYVFIKKSKLDIAARIGSCVSVIILLQMSTGLARRAHGFSFSFARMLCCVPLTSPIHPSRLCNKPYDNNLCFNARTYTYTILLCYQSRIRSSRPR